MIKTLYKYFIFLYYTGKPPHGNRNQTKVVDCLIGGLVGWFTVNWLIVG